LALEGNPTLVVRIPAEKGPQMSVETTTITADPWKRLEQNGYQVLDLAVAIEALRNNEHYLRTGHHALNLWKNVLLQALLIALGAGGTLEEHAAPGAATVHVLDGEVRVTIGGEIVYLTAGEMMTLSDMTRHAVEAVHPSILLVTIGPN
jgi:quercetin dioxygenase-like cupin family protein